MTPGGSAVPHEGWADVYDLVLERTFGSELVAFTDTTVGVVRELASPPARVVDFGAGTGRVALPLSELGFRVTAVDPSPAMLGRLARKEREPGRVARVVAPVEAFVGAGDQDLALCVFSVLGYLVTVPALQAAFRGMASALRPGGAVVVDVPGPEVLEGFEVESEDVLRYVDIEPVTGVEGLYDYLERTAVRRAGGVRRFEESFRVRAWKRGEILAAAGAAGLALEAELTHRFEAWGADYLLLRRDG